MEDLCNLPSLWIDLVQLFSNSAALLLLLLLVLHLKKSDLFFLQFCLSSNHFQEFYLQINIGSLKCAGTQRVVNIQ